MIFNIYLFKFFIDRYKSDSKKVKVDNYRATEVNFTLAIDDSLSWSERKDFNLEKNLALTYLSNSAIDETLAQLENEYPETVEFLANDNEWSMKIHGLRITSPEKDGVRK